MPVIVVDIPAEAGKALLSFLYCGEAHVPVTVIPHLVIGAKFLGISGFGDPVSNARLLFVLFLDSYKPTCLKCVAHNLQINLL